MHRGKSVQGLSLIFRIKIRDDRSLGIVGGGNQCLDEDIPTSFHVAKLCTLSQNCVCASRQAQ